MKGYRTFALSLVGMVCLTAIAIVCLMKGLTIEATSCLAGVMALAGAGVTRTMRREP